MSEARQIDQRYLIDESAICCGQLYRKLHSSLAAPSMMLVDYQRLLADRCQNPQQCRLCAVSHSTETALLRIFTTDWRN